MLVVTIFGGHELCEHGVGGHFVQVQTSSSRTECLGRMLVLGPHVQGGQLVHDNVTGMHRGK